MERQQEFVLRTLEERDIRFVRLWFTDVLGVLKSVAVAPAELEGAFDEGIGFDGSAIEGFARVYEADMLAKPDPSTFQVLPWRGDSPGHGADVLRHRHARRHPVAGRSALRPAPHAAPRPPTPGSPSTPTPRSSSSCSATVRSGDGAVPPPVDQGGYFDLTPHDVTHDFRRDAITMLERMGISVEFSHHEVAPGQQEIDLRYADALTTADNIMTFRLVVKEVALSAGRLRHLHAEAVQRPARLGDAHPPLAVRGRPQRLLRPVGPAAPVEGREVVHRRPARARRRDHRGDQPVGQLLQAADLGRRGAVLRLAGGTTTAPRWCGCRCTSRTRASRPASSCAPRTRPATRT